MKRPVVSLDLLSLFAGAGMTVLLMVAASAAFPAGGPADRDIQRTSVLGQPSPYDNITIFQGTVYTVPSGKRFVLTSLGVTSSNADVYLHFDGSSRLRIATGTSITAESILSVPDFVIAEQGTAITVESNSPYGVATGYLIDA